MKPRAGIILVHLLPLLVSPGHSAISSTFSLWNTNAEMVIDDVILGSTQSFMYATSGGKARRDAPDLTLTALDVASLISSRTNQFSWF
jgi:hypothetical protein